MNFFECELPVFVCEKGLVGFLRIYEDTGKYFLLTDRTNAFHFRCRSFCVYFQIKLKKRLIPELIVPQPRFLLLNLTMFLDSRVTCSEECLLGFPAYRQNYQ